MSEERKTRKKSGNGVKSLPLGISPELRDILERKVQEGEVEAGIDAAIEERIIVTREEILRLREAQPKRRPRHKKKPPDK